MSDWTGWTYRLNSNSSVSNTYCLGSGLDRPNGFTRKSGMVVAISTLKTVFPSNSRKDCEDRFSIQFKEGLEGNFLKIINQMDCTHLYNQCILYTLTNFKLGEPCWTVSIFWCSQMFTVPRSLWTLLLSLRLKKLGRKFYQSPIKSNFCYIAIPLGGLEQDFLVSSISMQ